MPHNSVQRPESRYPQCDPQLPVPRRLTVDGQPACMQGECVAPPTPQQLAVLENTPGAAGLLPFRGRQCLVMSNEDLFHTISPQCAAFACPLSPAVWPPSLCRHTAGVRSSVGSSGSIH